MKKLTLKSILLLILAAILCGISVAMLVYDAKIWIASLFGFAAALILVIIALTKNKKTYTTELVLVGIDPQAPQGITWAYCELNGNQFKLAIPNHVCKAHKLVAGARYKVDYHAIADIDPTTSGMAVKMKKITKT